MANTSYLTMLLNVARQVAGPLAESKIQKMASELSRLQWVEILQNPVITRELDLSIFQVLYSFENHCATASQVGRILGYTGKTPQGPLNLEIGRYAKRIANEYDINFTERSSRQFKFWDLFFNGWDRENRFVWQLKSSLKEALEETDLTGEERIPEELLPDSSTTLLEGIGKTILVNTYERNAKARRECVKYWGTYCIVCGFDFEKEFGKIGKEFIHVHHLTPISEIGAEYEIDPISDLRPICANCHAMIHRQSPPFTIEELQEIKRSSNEETDFD